MAVAKAGVAAKVASRAAVTEVGVAVAGVEVASLAVGASRRIARAAAAVSTMRWRWA